jgi:hypothetical protein
MFFVTLVIYSYSRARHHSISTARVHIKLTYTVLKSTLSCDFFCILARIARCAFKHFKLSRLSNIRSSCTHIYKYVTCRILWLSTEFWSLLSKQYVRGKLCMHWVFTKWHSDNCPQSETLLVTRMRRNDGNLQYQGEKT